MSQSQQVTDPILSKAFGRLVKISLGTAIVLGVLYLSYWGYETYVSIEERGVAETLLR